MSETLRDLVVSLSLNSDNFARNIRSVQKQIQEAQSAFKLASAGVQDFEKTAAGLATIGQVGNIDHSNVSIGKAGRKRHMGIRPTVRGSVMNPCDHPHGGGEGKSPIGRPGPVTPWGKPTLGYKTRKTKNRTNKFIVKRRNAK